MGKAFFRIEDKTGFEDLLQRSVERPVIIFKHSNTCGISSAAYREMEKVEEEIILVVVQTAREVSREIAVWTGIRHESPQVIVLKGGRPVWNASHYEVNARSVAAAVKANT